MDSDGYGVKVLVWEKSGCVCAAQEPLLLLQMVALEQKTGICKPLTCRPPAEGTELLLIKGTASHCLLGRSKLNASSHFCELCKSFIFCGTRHEDMLQRSWYSLFTTTT